MRNLPSTHTPAPAASVEDLRLPRLHSHPAHALTSKASRRTPRRRKWFSNAPHCASSGRLSLSSGHVLCSHPALLDSSLETPSPCSRSSVGGWGSACISISDRSGLRLRRLGLWARPALAVFLAPRARRPRQLLFQAQATHCHGRVKGKETD